MRFTKKVISHCNLSGVQLVERWFSNRRMRTQRGQPVWYRSPVRVRPREPRVGVGGWGVGERVAKTGFLGPRESRGWAFIKQRFAHHLHCLTTGMFSAEQDTSPQLASSVRFVCLASETLCCSEAEKQRLQQWNPNQQFIFFTNSCRLLTFIPTAPFFPHHFCMQRKATPLSIFFFLDRLFIFRFFFSPVCSSGAKKGLTWYVRRCTSVGTR